MLNLSIMNMNPDHIDEICADIIEQQKTGVSTHALFMMKFNPEYNPAVNKAERECELYDLFHEKLDKAGAKHGAFVQATLGHVFKPRENYQFTPIKSLVTGEDFYETVCPYDEEFRKYIKEQMRILATRKPSIVMIDDDCGVLYRPKYKGCACEHHMAEFNRRANTNMTREELYAHTQGNSEEDKYYTDIYVQLQKETLLGAIKAMREGLDEVDPTIQGINSGIFPGGFCEFSGEVAEIFAGKNNPRIIRLNGGPYTKPSRFFTRFMYNAAALVENTKDKVDIYLAETDTCPHNRYSTSATHMHGHFTASILEGAEGAKHWITRLGQYTYEPGSGKAYRNILSKNAKFYEKLSEYVKEFTPFGCRIPVTLKQNYDFVPEDKGFFVSPWSTCVLERFGLPLYFGNTPGGAVFLDNNSVDTFDDETIKEFFKGTVILSGVAAEKLNKRGFSEHTGVRISEWNGAQPSLEIYKQNAMGRQYECKEIKISDSKTEVLSNVVNSNFNTNSNDILFPGVTRLKNPAGGETIVFCGNPNTNYSYTFAFSMLNETRKKQFIDILSEQNHLPIYYPEDSEIYLRAGYLKNGEIMAVFFNLSYDQHEDVPIVCNKEIKKIEKLNPDGTKSVCEYTQENGVIRIKEQLNTLMPLVLFIS